MDTESKLSSKLARMRLFPPPMDMQYAPPRFPTRGSASIQFSRNAISATVASDAEKVRSWPTMNDAPSSHVQRFSPFPTGAARSHQSSTAFPRRRALARK